MARINRILSLIAVTVASLAVTVDAQVDMMMTNYVEALNYYNAAAIGTSDYLRVRVGGRWDRIGADPAPKSFMLTGDMPLPLLGNKLAAGVVAQRESIGLYRNITAGLQCGYKITTGRSSSVTLAVQAGIIDNEFRWSERELPESDAASDEAGDIPIEDQRHSAVDLSLGAFYNSRHFWAGVSVTHLTRSQVTLDVDGYGDNAVAFNAGRKFYLMVGGNIPIKNTLFEILPSVMVKSDFTFTTGEITARARYNKFLSFGIGYRWNDAVVATVAAEFKNFYLGYSYDYATSAIAKASSGSHEIFAGYRLKLDLSDKNRNKQKNIRIM